MCNDQDLPVRADLVLAEPACRLCKRAPGVNSTGWAPDCEDRERVTTSASTDM
jgi:hypothetical protein